MIRQRIGTLFIIILCFILQTTFFQEIEIAGAVPNLLLIVTVSVAYMKGRTEGMMMGLVCGLLSDMVFGSVIGLYALIFLVIGYCNGYSNRIYYGDDFTIPLLLVAVSDIIYNFLYYIFEFLLRGRLHILFYATRVVIPELIYTLFVTVVIYKMLHLLNDWLSPKPKEEA